MCELGPTYARVKLALVKPAQVIRLFQLLQIWYIRSLFKWKLPNIFVGTDMDN